jgi:hypothetical protein
MRNQFQVLTMAISASAVVAVLGLAAAIPIAGQAPVYKAPRNPADGKANLNGIWQAVNTANWDLQAHSAYALPGLSQLGSLGAVPPGPGVVEGDDIPYQAAAAVKKKENFANRLTADPEVRCYQPGVPRATYVPFPFQIVQSQKYILLVYTYANGVRTIHMEKAKPAPVDSWMGHSVGHWEGDTLVVNVTDFNDQTWFDRAGNFHSDALHVVERYTPIGPDALMYEATIDDPKVFTRLWKISMPLYRRLEKNAEIVPFNCVEFTEELIYGHLRKKNPK